MTINFEPSFLVCLSRSLCGVFIQRVAFVAENPGKGTEFRAFERSLRSDFSHERPWQRSLCGVISHGRLSLVQKAVK